MPLSVVILAAGKGTRMRSNLPKVLHTLAGQALVEHVLDKANALDSDDVYLVYGHGADAMRTRLSGRELHWVLQAEQLGTGHAVNQALPDIPDDHTVLVLYGDVPLTRAATLQAVVDCVDARSFGLLTVDLPDPTGYGRIVRAASSGSVERIVEQKDANPDELGITETNTGIMAANAADLRGWLNEVGCENAQGEYYLTDVIEMAVRDGKKVATCQPESPHEVSGVNSKRQLAELERIHQQTLAAEFLAGGLMIRDPARFDLRGRLDFGADCEVDVNVVFEGRVQLGDRVVIGPNCVIRNATIADDTVINASCVIEDAKIGSFNKIGPMARLRPGAETADHVHVGNFVEIKKSTVAAGAKVNHLSYVGDADIGERVNVGAGTITCNYDGANKHRTVIESDVFVGSNTALVAPITVGKGATIGAGSTLSKDVPAEKLIFTRPRPTTIDGWTRPVKKKT